MSAAGIAALLAAARAFVELVLRARLRRWKLGVCEEFRGRLLAGKRHLEVLIRSCYGAGKTKLAAMLALWWTATRPDCRGLPTAPTWAALEGLLWIEVERLYRGSLLAAAGVGRLLTGWRQLEHPTTSPGVI